MTMELDLLDESIMEKVVEGRERYHACTARWVANELRMSPDVCRYRLQKMKDHGLVDWNDMPGSLTVLVQAPDGERAGPPMPEQEDRTTDGSTADPAPDAASSETEPTSTTEEPSSDPAPRSATGRPAAKRKKKAAPRKAAAKKRAARPTP